MIVCREVVAYGGLRIPASWKERIEASGGQGLMSAVSMCHGRKCMLKAPSKSKIRRTAVCMGCAGRCAPATPDSGGRATGMRFSCGLAR